MIQFTVTEDKDESVNWHKMQIKVFNLSVGTEKVHFKSLSTCQSPARAYNIHSRDLFCRLAAFLCIFHEMYLIQILLIRIHGMQLVSQSK
jgi:hypothetical protein